MQTNYTSATVNFIVVEVEKFDTARKLIGITKHEIDDIEYIVGIRKSGKSVLLYKALADLNSFRRVSYELDGQKIFGFNDVLINERKLLEHTDLNVPSATLTVNTPLMQTSKGGSYLNNEFTTANRVVLKLLNQDREAVKSVTINGTKINNLGKNVYDVYSTYVLDKAFKIKQGFDIVIETNENDKILEVQGIEIDLAVKGV